MTLVEVVIAIAIVVVAFGAFAALFQASLRYVSLARAREAAVSLAVERMEEMRALAYADVGTVGGIPAGNIPQNEIVSLNNIDFNRRTFIQYVDDPADGIGLADQNSIVADYKRAKTEVSWLSSYGTSSVKLISNYPPEGIETGVGQGTLSIGAIDASASPVSDAEVHIVNTSAIPPIDVTTYTNVDGVVLFPGTPAASAFEISVTKPGYSMAETYAVTGGNPNPNPGHLTVSVGQTTTASFAIDALASLLVRTWEPIRAATTTDLFNDASGIAVQTQTVLSGGAIVLDTDISGDYYATGFVQTTAIAPAFLSEWATLSWSAAEPLNTFVVLHIYEPDGFGGYVLVPDIDLPGNSAGFIGSPVDLSNVSTSTYPALSARAELLTTDPLATPSFLDWSLSYKEGPIPLPNASFVLQGNKTIGSDGTGASIYKVLQTLTTDASALYSTPSLEWDAYTLAVDPLSGYDLSSSCPLQPLSVEPGSSKEANLFLVAHTADSLRVVVIDASTGNPIPEASVNLSRIGFDDTKESDACGQAFFAGLASASDYAISVSASGYVPDSLSSVSVDDQSSVSVSLTAI